MKVPAFPKSCLRPSPRHRERGVTMVLVALCMMAMIAMAALSIDVVTLYLAREEAQRSADAAALAAARIISLSGITNITTTATSKADWQLICGLSSTNPAAFLTAQAVAVQNAVAGTSPTVTVQYSVQGGAVGSNDCSTLPAAFAINPTVIVKVTNSSLPTLFSRIWSRAANSVNATAVAEVFNPSNVAFDLGQTAVQIVPRCVKPWIIPNKDPGAGGNPFVDEIDGTIKSPGVRPTTVTASVGESFTLTADCVAGGFDCNPANGNMINNPPNAGSYIPSLITVIPIAVPACADDDLFQGAIGGCDQATAYQCGIQNGGSADLTINPGGSGGDTAAGTQCLINQIANGLGQGQDSMDYTAYPYKMMSGTKYQITALASANAQLVTASNSVVSLPIYDNVAAGTLAGPQPTITILGFLQVFIDSVDTTTGNLNLHVLNVAGCGNAASTTVFAPGTSPVPIRLITSQ